MIERQTVFILGAGASVPYKFPTADQLNKDIIEHFENNLKNWATENYRQSPLDRNRINWAIKKIVDDTEKFRGNFRKGPGLSIDRYLTDNPSFLSPGKKAILLSIALKEHLSRFLYEVDIEYRKQDWYKDLFNELIKDFRGPKNCQINKNHVSFVTFNYDRSLEHFLHMSLTSHYTEMSTDILTEEILSIPIIHVYGTIGNLPWQNSNSVEYGSRLNEYDINQLVDNLFVIKEERENPNAELAKAEIQKAKRIFFLGFGFAEDNLQVLDIPKILPDDVEIYATNMGLTNRKKDEIDKLLRKPSRQVHIGENPTDCVKLLEEHFLSYR